MGTAAHPLCSLVRDVAELPRFKVGVVLIDFPS